MAYDVKFVDNLGSEDCIQTFETEQEAEKSIIEDMENVKTYFE